MTTQMDLDTIRALSFGGVLAGMALWETLAPRRASRVRRGVRWANNLAVIGLGTLALRLIVPFTLAGVAALASERGIGVLQRVTWPAWLELTLSVVVLDLVIYLQHAALHFVPVLWRLHRMHHTDPDVDASTGLRFHPLEIALSLGIKCVAVIALGATPEAVLVFEIVLNATSMFEHANVRIPVALDRVLRSVIVTPDMHRVHHSVHRDETDSNFGFNLSCWDRLLGTYRAQPRDGHEGMTLGVANTFRTERDLWIDRLLAEPWLSDRR